MKFGLCASVAIGLVMAAPLPAVAQSATVEVLPDVHPLEPGAFVWHEQPTKIAASAEGAPVSFVVSLLAQRGYLYRGGQLLAETTVSTGAPGYDTPTGEFTILQKREFHRSNLYDDAPMPHMQRLTWDGIALHAGKVPGYPASHGCVRLPAKFAKQLFALTEMGGKVTIVYDLAEAAEPYQAATPQFAAADGEGAETGLGAVDDPNIRPASWVTGPARAGTGGTGKGTD